MSRCRPQASGLTREPPGGACDASMRLRIFLLSLLVVTRDEPAIIVTICLSETVCIRLEVNSAHKNSKNGDEVRLLYFLRGGRFSFDDYTLVVCAI